MFKTRVIVLFSTQLESISIDGVEMSDISSIKNKPIREWFLPSGGRDGWKGLIEEIKEIVDDESSILNFEFHGPIENKHIFEGVLESLGLKDNTDGISREEITLHSILEAEKAERRGLYQKAFQLYMNAAEYGKSQNAQFMVANYYYNRFKGEDNGVDLEPNDAIVGALEFYEKAANQNHAPSQFKLFQILYYGDGVNVDEAEALKYLKMAAIHGNKEAQRVIAEKYYNGEGFEKDLAEAISWYKNAALAGDVTSQMALGFIYKNMDSNHYKEALNWFNMAVEVGAIEAMVQVAQIYLEFDSNEDENNKNLPEKAIELLLKAAKEENNEAQFLLGICYERGLGVPRNVPNSLYWYELAAKKDNFEAQLKYIALHNDDHFEGDEFQKLLSWYITTAEKGSLDSQKKLGKLYEEGDRVNQSYKDAIKWYELAAMQGDIEMQEKCADWYFSENYIPLDEKKSFCYASLAASKNSVSAIFRLARCYQEGFGVAENISKAMELFEKAAENGHVKAMYFLGECLLDCGEAEKDIQKAVKLIQRASDEGYLIATYSLAFIYDKGVGVSADYGVAHELMKKVADSEDMDYIEYIKDACYLIALSHEESIDTSKKSRSLALLSASVLIPMTNVVTIPAALLGNKIAKDIKYKNFIKTQAGIEMLHYYLKGSNKGHPECRARVRALKAFY